MADEVDLHIGRRIRRRRRILQLTQRQLAARVGVTFQQVQKYEYGEARIGASRLLRISRTLEISLNYFFEGLDEPSSAPASAAAARLSPPRS